MIEVRISGETAVEIHNKMRVYLGDTDISRIPSLTTQEDEVHRKDFLTRVAEVAPTAENLDAAVPSQIPTLTAASATDTASVDSRGLPWDHRIHASSKDKTTKGEWRRRRGVEDHVVAAVEQELIAKVKSVQSQEMLPPPAQPVPAAASPAILPFPIPVQAPVAPPVPVLPTPTMPNAHTPQTFKTHIVPIFAKLAKEGKINQEYVQNLKNHFGVQEIHLVNDEQAAGLFKTFVDCHLIQAVQ